MIDRFYNQLRTAVIERRAAHCPGRVSVIVAVNGFTLVCILLAMILVPYDEPRHYHFVREKGAITALSAIFLAAASAFSFASLLALIRAKEPNKWAWFVLALGFAFFSFDELLQFHEQVGRMIGRIANSGPFRNWNDVLVILYGVVALPVLIAMLPSLMRWRTVVEMFAIAFVFYGIHTFIDSTSDPATSTSIILEESAKLLAGACLLIGTIVGFVGVLWKNSAFGPTKNDA